MISRAATIEAGGQVEGHEAAGARRQDGREARSPETSRKDERMKFLYASGSRPLDGYTIKRGIGRGGFGEVYFATSEAGKEVALKHVERNLEVELRGVGQCLNLKHVNLIDLFDIRYDEQGDAWVVMEYVSGASLKDVIDRNPNGLPLDQVEHWFRGIAAGTAYLHEHGIVHRDLKPGNIFEDAGCVKIGDYGLSKFISTSRKSAQTESVGTFHYMAPEIGKGVYGKEIDIYALGVVLYEMLSGRVPFDGESSQEIIMKHLTADPDLSGIPQPYRSIIQRALQKDPQKRFGNVSEMLAALDHKPAAATKPGSGVSPPVTAPSFLAGLNGKPAEPLYIGDEDDDIRLGPLELHPENAPVTAELVKANGRQAIRQASPAAGEEPIAKALKDGWTKFAHWWNHGPATTPIKIALLVVVAIVAIVNGGWLVPAAAVLGAVYLTYLGIRMLSQVANRPGESPFADRYREELRPHNAGWHLTWEQHGRQMLCEKTGGDRIGELTGSMLAAAAIAAVLAVVMAAIGGETLDDSPNSWAGGAWLWLMTTFGSWLVLAAGKWCEPRSGEQVKRRFAMLVLGLVFASAAWASSNYLMVSLTDGNGLAARDLVWEGLSRHMYDVSGTPQLAAFLAYFGAIFLTIGWWKQVDPLRASRLRIAPILVTIFVASMWWLVFGFPQPWGFMLAAAISITAQLSAPWLSPADRTAAAQRRGIQIT